MVLYMIDNMIISHTYNAQSRLTGSCKMGHVNETGMTSPRKSQKW